VRFSVRRGVLINVADPELQVDGSNGVTECHAGFSIPGGGISGAANGEQIAVP
jgi:hypothetical protein